MTCVGIMVAFVAIGLLLRWGAGPRDFEAAPERATA